MSTKRYIDTKFWTDPFVMQLTPEQKFFYLYLFTNGDCNLAGVYETTIPKISFETGFNTDQINEMLDFFEKQDKVKHVDNFILLKNFIKHQNVQNSKIRAGIMKILDDLCMTHPYLIHDLSHLNLNLIKFNLNLNKYNLNSNSDESSDNTLTPPQKNYAKEIFDLWTAAKLPCAKDLLSFTSRDFKQSLQYLKGYHSNEVIEAVKNYISVLADSDCWVTSKMTFYGFVTWKRFADFIPGNFQHENFLSWDKRGKKTASAPKTELHEEKQYYKCPKCGKPSLFADISSMQWLCSDCNSSFPLMDLTPEACNE